MYSELFHDILIGYNIRKKGGHMSLTGSFSLWVKRLVGMTVEIENECTDETVLADFLNGYRSIADDIASHLRYEREFLDQKKRTKDVYDPFAIGPYSERLEELATSIVQSCSTVAFQQPVYEKELDTRWILLCQTLLPSSPAIIEQLKESIRVQLGSRLLLAFWRTSEENLGAFIRRYYDLVYKTPESILSGTFPEELMRLLKECVEDVQETVSSEMAPSVTTGTRSAGASAPSTEYVLRFALDRHGVSDKADLRKLRSVSPVQIIITSVLFVLSASFVFDAARVFVRIGTLTDVPVSLHPSPVTQAVALSVFVLFLVSYSTLLARYLRFASLKRTIATLVVTQTLPSPEVRTVFTKWFGDDTARRLMRKH